MDVIYVVTQTESAVLGRTAGARVTADELIAAGCDIDALIFGSHIALATSPKSTPATPTTDKE